MKISFPDLPYAMNALEPHYSAKTLELHYGKHHRTYFDTTVKLIKGGKFEDMTLEQIVQAQARDKNEPRLFNNAAQAWNHEVFWRSMQPNGGGRPGGEMEKAMGRDFGGYDGMRKALRDAAVKQFGSGWAWLFLQGGKLAVSSTGNAETPMMNGSTVLLALDIWEHAYYLDYQNRRPDYVDVFLDHLINWRYAEKRFAEAAAHERDTDRARKRA